MGVSCSCMPGDVSPGSLASCSAPGCGPPCGQQCGLPGGPTCACVKASLNNGSARLNNPASGDATPNLNGPDIISLLTRPSCVGENSLPLRVVVAFPESDSVREALLAGIRSLGWISDVVGSEAAAAATVAATATAAASAGKIPAPDLAIVDLRHYKLIDGEAFCRAMLAHQSDAQCYMVAYVNRSMVEKPETVSHLLSTGFSRWLYDIHSSCHATSELLLIQNAIQLRGAARAVSCALDRGRDLVLIADRTSPHPVYFVSSCGLRLLGWRREEAAGRPLSDFLSDGVRPALSGLADEMVDQWEGTLAARTHSGEPITVHCRATVHRTAPHLLVVCGSPVAGSTPAAAAAAAAACSSGSAGSTGGGATRGSLSSIRKGSYDVKSINSDGMVSIRRQSLAKLSALPIEAPITKVIALISAAQETSPASVVQTLDKVVDILRTTELYSSHLKEDQTRLGDPVAADLIGALLTQGPVPSATARRSSNDSASTRVALASSGKAMQVRTLAPPGVKDLLELSLNWDFPVFRLEELTGRRPLVWLGMHVLNHFSVAGTLGCDERILRNWLLVVERHYRQGNSYHNSTHAADVLQAAAAYLRREVLQQLLDPLDAACCLLAAIAHDIDHPGRSSAFLCNSGSELAVLYNDQCVLESHHAALTFKLTLADDRVNIFKGLERDTYKVARQSVIDMILATEMTKHFEHLAKFVSVFNKPTRDDDVTSQEEKLVEVPDMSIFATSENVGLVKRMLIKCADVSNPSRPLPMAVEWARRIAEEYFLQTEEEKAKKLPVVMPMFDRLTCSIPKSQIGFVDFIINDMFEAWEAFIDFPEILYHMRRNYQFWRELEERCVTVIDNMDSLQETLAPELPDYPDLWEYLSTAGSNEEPRSSQENGTDVPGTPDPQKTTPTQSTAPLSSAN